MIAMAGNRFSQDPRRGRRSESPLERYLVASRCRIFRLAILPLSLALAFSWPATGLAFECDSPLVESGTLGDPEGGLRNRQDLEAPARNVSAPGRSTSTDASPTDLDAGRSVFGQFRPGFADIFYGRSIVAVPGAPLLLPIQLIVAICQGSPGEEAVE